MPIYEYSCESCGKITDALQKVDDPPPPACTSCGVEGKLTKVVSRTSFVLKGGGWYSDLYGSKGSGSSGAGSSGASGASASSAASSTASASPAPAASSSTSTSTAASSAAPAASSAAPEKK